MACPKPTETTDVCDANSPLLATGELRVLNQIFKPYGLRRAFSGRVVTVKSFEDNAAVVEAIFENHLREPKVLVIDAGGSLRRSMVGSIIAQMAHDMGWAGIVVNGCIRDIDYINAMDIGIRALGCVPVRSSKKGGGEKHVTVQFAGALIRDGEWLCADNSGILVSNFELSVLGPTYRPILHKNGTNSKDGGHYYYYYTHTIADYTSPAEPHRLFAAHFLDDHNFLPKFVPESYESIEYVVGESTAVGSIKLIKFPQGNPFKYMKNMVDEIDNDNLYIKYTTIEGDILGDKWDHIVYEVKIEPSITGSHFRMTGHYHAKKDAVPTEEDVIFGQDELKHIHKIVQESVMLNPQLYV
ncbi:hypothetical protein SOVF_042260 [Spinacia oleracea]|uniref:4-hydroxy-4-methyl-2-oxoglutarate aldolase n=1 Tax=Spinacia oleracea TaxID=3562 RepID=A0ABM3QIC0_SPIOL|nr:uncharacterized protein LOC110804606 [Spinacia oleracea]XP_056683104.1 uncharacterized protein LOC110804606 [Spinacia oleracea]XP_056683105.1 uncharacterized protein LOC110804606 [Spinacia oleracea]XP_056683106.1 uncharacterized protein LOC110804606 [Spinacia oleracea]XP_056683107.1 uncharacterized protein LOC110804606 [Spinacia oleracea]XP_056683108.1 uncharacterized protein LOC110804606 [Spinacia oleracea]KNA21528.1 hypothetical protein SOVF_042260 [Spinacia oleracea]